MIFLIPEIAGNMLAFIKKKKKRELQLSGKKGDHHNISLDANNFSVFMNCTS